MGEAVVSAERAVLESPGRSDWCGRRCITGAGLTPAVGVGVGVAVGDAGGSARRSWRCCGGGRCGCCSSRSLQ